MRKITISLLLFTAITAPTAFSQNGLYIGLEGGATLFTGLPNNTFIGANTSHQNYITFRPSLGYNHDLFPRFGLGFEIGSAWYAHTKYAYANGASTTISYHDLEFLPVGIVHMCPKWDLFIKIGGTRFNTDVSGVNASWRTTTNITLETGLGVAYNFTSHLALALNYAHIFSNSKRIIYPLRIRMPSVNSGLLGLRFNFGS